MESLLAYRHDLHSRGILFSFCGSMTQAVLVAMAEAVEHRLTDLRADVGTSSRLFSVFIEQMQNIVRHGNLANRALQDLSLCVVGFDEAVGAYFVSSGNAITLRDSAKLKSRIEEINAMDSEELARLHRERIRSEPGSMGAGLGLIEMARRSDSPLEFCSEKLDASHEYFTVSVWIR